MYFVCFYLLARVYTARECGYIRGKLFEYIGIGWKLGIPMYFVLAIMGDTSEMAYIGPSRCIFFLDFEARTSGWALKFQSRCIAY